MRPGTKVIKNPETWVPNDFDKVGRGSEIGYVVRPPFPLGRDQVQVIWSGVRHFEETKQLLRVTKRTKLQLTKAQLKRLKFIMSAEYYTPLKDLPVLSEISIRPYKEQVSLKYEAHALFDLIRTPQHERSRIWADHKKMLKEYSDVYKLKPVKEGRDNKDVMVGSGYGRNSIRYPRKGHKSAWKKFYKLFPKLHPDYVYPVTVPASTEAQRIMNKSSS